MHPWLNYQNLSDGPVQLTSASTGYLEDFGLGRKSTESLIAKSTTAIKALQLCRNYVENFSSNSFRVPTPIVSAAVITVNTNYTINSSSDILNIFSKAKNITLTDLFSITEMVSSSFSIHKKGRESKGVFIEFGFKL